jgi:hypothetical protein
MAEGWRLLAMLVCLIVLFSITAAVAQETTGGVQGTVKDPTGAVVSNADVELTGSSLCEPSPGHVLNACDGTGIYAAEARWNRDCRRPFADA